MRDHDPIFPLRRLARTAQCSAMADLFAELDDTLVASAQYASLVVIFVHGGLSCCFDSFADLFTCIQRSATLASVNHGAGSPVRFLRFEHDTYQPIRSNAEQLCHLLTRLGADAELVLLGHSRGGLVARLASDLLLDREPRRDDRLEVFTFGAPHGGTAFFDSDVTFVVERALQWQGAITHGLVFSRARMRHRGWLPALAAQYRFWRRARAQERKRSMRWPAGIEDVRMRARYFDDHREAPRCRRFWTFGSEYDVARNSQALPWLPRTMLRLVQATVPSNAPGDLVVALDSATAIGRPQAVPDVWHCGYFRSALGAKLVLHVEALSTYVCERIGPRPAFDQLAAG